MEEHRNNQFVYDQLGYAAALFRVTRSGVGDFDSIDELHPGYDLRAKRKQTGNAHVRLRRVEIAGFNEATLLDGQLHFTLEQVANLFEQVAKTYGRKPVAGAVAVEVDCKRLHYLQLFFPIV